MNAAARLVYGPGEAPSGAHAVALGIIEGGERQGGWHADVVHLHAETALVQKGGSHAFCHLDHRQTDRGTKRMAVGARADIAQVVVAMPDRL